MVRIRNVLFLCSGNTSRSPAAEYLAKWLKKTKFQDELKDVFFDSAGLYSYFKVPREGTAKYLQSKGIDFNDFRGKQIDEKLLKNQNLILGFEHKWHIKKLKRRFKKFKDLDEKVFLLFDLIGEKNNNEIPDPINFEPEEYREIMEKIEYGVEKALQKIIEINTQEANNDQKEN
jgi:protein-tyrosine-phosphatase